MERTLNRDKSPSVPISRPYWLSLYARLRQWQRNARTRRQLARLDSRQLADAGISEAQRQCELDKPFWR